MDKNKAKQYLEYLDEKYTEWYTHPKQRSKIAAEIYDAAMHWEDEIYLYLNDNRANGLFEHGFFESDVQQAFEKLKEIVNEGNPKPENKLFKLYTILQNYKASQDNVPRKELKDYLLEKIHNGELKDKKITFRDDEDFAYFSRLTESIGVETDAFLEDIVMRAFVQE